MVSAVFPGTLGRGDVDPVMEEYPLEFSLDCIFSSLGDPYILEADDGGPACTHTRLILKANDEGPACTHTRLTPLPPLPSHTHMNTHTHTQVHTKKTTKTHVQAFE